MGYYVSVSIDIKSHQSPLQIVKTMQNAGIEMGIEDIHQEGCFSYWHYSACDYKLSPEGKNELIRSLMELEPIATDSVPNLVFCDDLEQTLWGYQITGRQALPYVAIMQADTSAGSISYD
jgi:hypothetical protein